MSELTGQIGVLAEQCATDYLNKKGYRIVGRNYRKPWGEIDIIAEKSDVLVFVEVKANRKEITGFEPELRVNPNKRHRMVRIAKTFLVDFRFPTEQAWQMDVLAVTFVKERGVAKLKHYKNI
jgi:putative endonuclease